MSENYHTGFCRYLSKKNIHAFSRTIIIQTFLNADKKYFLGPWGKGLAILAQIRSGYLNGNPTEVDMLPLESTCAQMAHTLLQGSNLTISFPKDSSATVLFPQLKCLLIWYIFADVQNLPNIKTCVSTILFVSSKSKIILKKFNKILPKKIQKYVQTKKSKKISTIFAK